MRKVKEDYENEIRALKARLLGCEAAVRRLAAAHQRWVDDDSFFQIVDVVGEVYDEFIDRLYDLYHLARIDAPAPFEIIDDEGSNE